MVEFNNLSTQIYPTFIFSNRYVTTNEFHDISKKINSVKLGLFTKFLFLKCLAKKY